MDGKSLDLEADEQLSVQIVDRFAEAGLFCSGDHEEMRVKIATGTAREIDWAHWAEAAISRKLQDKNNVQG